MRVNIARVIRSLKILRNMTHTRSIYWSRYLHDARLSTRIVRRNDKSQEIFLWEIDVSIARNRGEYLLEGYMWAKSLKNRAKAKFDMNHNGLLTCSIQDARFYVTSAEELFILHEIYVSGVYNISISGPVVVWDIGMNVGMASLFFAQRFDRVVGYEPFEPTYEYALRNIALNPHLLERIKPHNTGIGGSRRTQIEQYALDRKGSMGKHSNVDFDRVPHVTQERIVVEDAVECLDSLCHQYPDMTIVAKIDCEGAEYEILNHLYQSGRLPRIDAIMLEWHRLGPDHLLKLLQDAGFTTFASAGEYPDLGMIYGIRRTGGSFPN